MATTDLQYLREYSSNDNDFIVEMIELFLNNTPGFLKEMQEAFDEYDYPTVGKIAHKIKPSMTFMGISNGKEVCLALEEQGKSDKPDREVVESKVNELTEVCNSAFQELQKSLDELKS
jgi:HPt (histidine-containing phosphotransfer) domain-containing protein